MSTQLAGPGPAIALAVLGAAFFAVAAVLQHGAVRTVADEEDGVGSLSPRRAGALLGRPGWLAGLAAAAAGAGLHLAALAQAPLSVVQPLGVLAVPIAVVITAWRARRRPDVAVLRSVVLVVGGVTVVVAVTAGGRAAPVSTDGAVLVGAGVAAAAVATLVAVAVRARGWVRCLAYAGGAAVVFGLVSTLARAVAAPVAEGTAGLDDPVIVATVGLALVALVVGGWLVQHGYASGPPDVVVATLAVVDPVVAVALGIALLGEGTPDTAGGWVVGLAAAAVATGAVIALARHHPEATHRSAEPTRRPRRETSTSIGSGGGRRCGS